ncbi:hypothetical protein BGZ73_004310 [Actinomortierella ambigua]|nr:hypothetical protein BGZ73_004310 [Actinomortierella ambigua]
MTKLSSFATVTTAVLAVLDTVSALPLKKRALSPEAMKNLPGWAIALIVVAPFIISFIIVCIVIAYKQRQIRKRTLKTSQLLGSNEYLAAHQNANLHSNHYTDSAQPPHELTTLASTVADSAATTQSSPDHTVVVPAPTLPPAYDAADGSVSAPSRT